MGALRPHTESEMASEENQSRTAIKHTWILPSNISLHHHRRSCRSGRENHRQPLPKFRDVPADSGVSTRERRKSLQVRDIDLELKPGSDGVKTFRHKDGTPYPKLERTQALGPRATT